ncbi:MAG TPA: class I SAM-dependent methyltransferase [Candidatus Uhrbacteria bacterium]|nr:class I SAM-dependent methyltransferase [Candidatus Uhrbacteria bacterium]
MKQNLSQKIIDANIELHKKSAKHYDKIHPEIFNKKEQGLINHVLAQVLAKIKLEKIKVLDLGAGTGNIALKLLNNPRIESIIAVDLSKEMLDELEKKAAVNSKLKIANKPADEFLADNEDNYDLITISSVLHHLPDYFGTIELILKKLAPGGVLVIFHEPTGEKSSLLSICEWFDSRLFVNLFLPKDLKNIVKSLDTILADYHVYHEFDLSGLKKFFKAKNNLEIIFFQKHNTFALRSLRLIGKYLPKKNNFILAAQKK